MFKDNISREPELVYVHRGAAPERVPTSLSGFLSRLLGDIPDRKQLVGVLQDIGLRPLHIPQLRLLLLLLVGGKDQKFRGRRC